jgi:hypothetical protein
MILLFAALYFDYTGVGRFKANGAKHCRIKIIIMLI